jgi:hypothetical protein
VTSAERFELVGRLYYAATGYLRPGKSNPLESARDANDSENGARFENYCATRLLTDAIELCVKLEYENEALTDQLDECTEGRAP